MVIRETRTERYWVAADDLAEARRRFARFLTGDDEYGLVHEDKADARAEANDRYSYGAAQVFSVTLSIESES